MSVTVDSMDERGSQNHTTLAGGLRTDEPSDKRSCPHDCHGQLTLINQDEDDTPTRVVCTLCRCSPSGTYYPPERKDSGDSHTGVQYSFFHPPDSSGGGINGYDPKRVNGGEEPDPRTYSNGTVRLPGGYEAVYDQDDSNRPDGVSSAYTFDLSTL